MKCATCIITAAPKYFAIPSDVMHLKNTHLKYREVGVDLSKKKKLISAFGR